MQIAPLYQCHPTVALLIHQGHLTRNEIFKVKLKKPYHQVDLKVHLWNSIPEIERGQKKNLGVLSCNIIEK